MFSAAEGGPGDMVVSTDPIQYVQRPWFLEHIRDGYAVIVTGESMSPVYEPGDMVLVNPKLAPMKGKNDLRGRRRTRRVSRHREAARRHDGRGLAREAMERTARVHPVAKGLAARAADRRKIRGVKFVRT